MKKWCDANRPTLSPLLTLVETYRKYYQVKRTFLDGYMKYINPTTEELAEYLVNSYVMQYPLSLLKTDSRNANLYPLGRKMALHYGMDNNFIKGTYNTLGVDTALQYCPLIPSCEKVEESDRQFNRRIYEPFEKTLRDLGFNYEFLLNGVVKNSDDIHGMSCTQYLKMSVSFSIPDVIIDVERLTRRKEEKAKAKQRKEKNNI